MVRSPSVMRTEPNRARQATWSQSLERGLAILSTFGDSERASLGVSELSRALGLSRSSTHRYVATLA